MYEDTIGCDTKLQTRQKHSGPSNRIERKVRDRLNLVKCKHVGTSSQTADTSWEEERACVRLSHVTSRPHHSFGKQRVNDNRLSRDNMVRDENR